jgi:hypothetical protein
MPEFRIRYTDPDTGETEEVVKEFNDSETASALEWAEDWAYAAADKGPHEVMEIKKFNRERS